MKISQFFVRYLILTAFGTAFLLGACASDPQTEGPSNEAAVPAPEPAVPTPAAEATPSSEVAGGEIKITLEENEFPEEIRLKVGTTVVFVINNKGNEDHEFEFPDFDVYGDIRSGKTVRIEWTVPDKKGEWDMGCFLTEPDGAHDGMEGIVIIE